MTKTLKVCCIDPSKWSAQPASDPVNYQELVERMQGQLCYNIVEDDSFARIDFVKLDADEAHQKLLSACEDIGATVEFEWYNLRDLGPLDWMKVRLEKDETFNL